MDQAPEGHLPYIYGHRSELSSTIAEIPIWYDSPSTADSHQTPYENAVSRDGPYIYGIVHELSTEGPPVSRRDRDPQGYSYGGLTSRDDPLTVTNVNIDTTRTPNAKHKAAQNSEATIGAAEKAIQAEPDRAARHPKTDDTASSNPLVLNPELGKALAAWKTLFGDHRQAKLGPTDKLPIHSTRFLGRGGGGEVHATEVGGIAVAWKRHMTTARRLTEEELNEANILEKISKRRHHHVVELIGSYIHRYKGGIELGLLMWPVAHCDLASFLEDVDFLGDWIYHLGSETLTSSGDDLESVLDSLHPLMPASTLQAKADDLDSLLLLYSASMRYLYTKLGCIGEAVAYLHQQDIRHKDLKPAQVLLSANGLWLTDFGWSRDTSHLTNSVTNGGDRITLRYHAPERAASGPCGKPEDIFALGCIYLEMGYRLARDPRQEGYAVPWARKPFYDSLEHLEGWVEPLSRASQTPLGKLAVLIKRMLLREPGDRPSISLVLADLRTDAGGSQETSFFTTCCCT
jgi:serine/threonine protein kinase